MKNAGFKKMKALLKSEQQELRWSAGHGGRRPGAGRKPGKGRRRVAHVQRPAGWRKHRTIGITEVPAAKGASR
jgi:hypothetical protein